MSAGQATALPEKLVGCDQYHEGESRDGESRDGTTITDGTTEMVQPPLPTFLPSPGTPSWLWESLPGLWSRFHITTNPFPQLFLCEAPVWSSPSRCPEFLWPLLLHLCHPPHSKSATFLLFPAVHAEAQVPRGTILHPGADKKSQLPLIPICTPGSSPRFSDTAGNLKSIFYPKLFYNPETPVMLRSLSRWEVWLGGGIELWSRQEL